MKKSCRHVSARSDATLHRPFARLRGMAFASTVLGITLLSIGGVRGHEVFVTNNTGKVLEISIAEQRHVLRESASGSKIYSKAQGGGNFGVTTPKGGFTIGGSGGSEKSRTVSKSAKYDWSPFLKDGHQIAATGKTVSAAVQAQFYFISARYKDGTGIICVNVQKSSTKNANVTITSSGIIRPASDLLIPGRSVFYLRINRPNPNRFFLAGSGSRTRMSRGTVRLAFEQYRGPRNVVNGGTYFIRRIGDTAYLKAASGSAGKTAWTRVRNYSEIKEGKERRLHLWRISKLGGVGSKGTGIAYGDGVIISAYRTPEATLYQNGSTPAYKKCRRGDHNQWVIIKP